MPSYVRQDSMAMTRLTPAATPLYINRLLVVAHALLRAASTFPSTPGVITVLPACNGQADGPAPTRRPFSIVFLLATAPSGTFQNAAIL